MAIDRLQDKIRKTKNPSVLELGASAALPPHLLADRTPAAAFGVFCRELMEALKDLIPAVRLSFSAFALLGPDGLTELSQTLRFASDCGYYVIVDGPELFSPDASRRAAQAFFDRNSLFPCDGLVISGYPGSDVWKPFLSVCREEKKDIFVTVRTGNRSASELQDLIAGSRQLHIAAADHVNRYAAELTGKCGYSQVAVMAGAGSADSLRAVRSKYPRLFLLVDGYDYPHANAKNCAGAFDRFGHGAAVCGSTGIANAWKETESDGTDYPVHAKAATLRMKKNLTRYVTVL